MAILDIAGYYILRAVAHYHSHPPQIQTGGGLDNEVVSGQPSMQAKYNLVIAYYLAGEISLSRASELLELSWLDVRTRFLRLDVPLRPAPADLEEAWADIDNATAWIAQRQD